MTDKPTSPEATDFEPDWVSPPGETIADLLEERGWDQAELATRTGFSTKHVNELVRGKKPISPDAAERLAKVLGSTSAFWLMRDAQYQAALERERALEECAKHAEWLKELPIHWMRTRGIAPDTRSKGSLVDRILRWFGVASVESWREAYTAPLTAWRASDKYEKKLGAVAVWLRAAELEAAAIACEPFDHEGFLARLPELRALTAEEDPNVFVPRAQAIGAAHGIAIVFVEAPPGCPVHGATRWLTPERALLALTLRYRANDVLWFSFFHEVAHLLKHGKKLFLVEGLDGLDPAQEAEADSFAADFLIPEREAASLRFLQSEQEVRAVARRLGVAPGIVVGRMQHEGWLPRSHLNGLKVRYEWEHEADE